MARIQDLWLKIKQFADGALAEWGIVAIVIVATLGAFGLGRLSVLVSARPLVTLEHAPMVASPAPLTMGGAIVASWSGSVYYYPWCSGAQKIAPANQRWFSDEASAGRAGYHAAKGCKGLSE